MHQLTFSPTKLAVVMLRLRHLLRLVVVSSFFHPYNIKLYPIIGQSSVLPNEESLSEDRHWPARIFIVGCDTLVHAVSIATG